MNSPRDEIPSPKVCNAASRPVASSTVSERTKDIKQIIQILDDPNTPIGAVIQASGIAPPSRLKQAMQGRLQTSGEPLLGGIIRSIADVHAILSNQITAAGGTRG